MPGLTIVPKEDDSEPKEDGNMQPMDPKHFDMVCNPAFYAFKAAIADFHKNPSNDMIERLHEILLLDNSQQHERIQKLIAELYPYIDRPELADKLLFLFCDISHLNAPITDSLLKFGIFDHIDYSNSMARNLILSMCDGNPEAWSVFQQKYLTDELAEDSKIKILIEQYKQ